MELQRPSDLTDLASAGLGNGAVALAGGTEVVPLVRDGLLHAETLVDISALVPRGIVTVNGVVTIGAATVLGELELSDAVPEALREACRLSASPQLRNMATIGGNLLQATRCWYWRLSYGCWLQGGSTCLAREGQGGEHAIVGNDRCASAHPSDPAAALLALGASVRTDRRTFPLADLYRLPTDEDRSLLTLESGELILELSVPLPDASVYLKAMDRARYAFALVGVAAARFGSDVRYGLAGVAPVPWAISSEAALDSATPLEQSAYKVQLARTLVGRARQAVDGA